RRDRAGADAGRASTGGDRPGSERWGTEARRLAFLPGGEQTAGVVEVQVGQDHQVDVFMREADGRQVVEQDVVVFLDAVALLEIRGEEGADAGFDEDVAPGLAHQQGDRKSTRLNS